MVDYKKRGGDATGHDDYRCSVESEVIASHVYGSRCTDMNTGNTSKTNTGGGNRGFELSTSQERQNRRIALRMSTGGVSEVTASHVNGRKCTELNTVDISKTNTSGGWRL
jgi:hypothetical protein